MVFWANPLTLLLLPTLPCTDDPTFDTDAMVVFKKEFARRADGFGVDLHVCAAASVYLFVQTVLVILVLLTLHLMLLQMMRFPPVSGDNVYLWNHLFSQAYMDGCDYMFQLCDDISFGTAGMSYNP